MARIKVPIDEDIAAAANVVKQAEKRATEKKPAVIRRPKGRTLPPIRKEWLVFAGVIVILLGLVARLSHDNSALNKQLQQIKANPQQLIDQQNAELVQRIGQLTDLPPGETPLIATVSDAAQAKAQSSFFASAQDGDKVLQYTKANKLVLYRPSTNKVIAVGSLNSQPNKP